MHSRLPALVPVIALLGAAAALAQERVPLEPRSHRTFDVTLPAERFTPVGDGIPVPHAGGDRFAARLEGTALLLDTDGDGEPETRIDGATRPGGGRTAFTILTATSPEGDPLRYAVRLRDVGAGWEWAASGSRIGKLDDTRVQIIDQDGDGRFDGVGDDAMIVGRGDHASFLSEVVSIHGALHRVRVAPDGSWMDVTPYLGRAGVLDVTSGFSADARVLSCVVRSTSKRTSFDVASVAGGMRVPVGVYALESATIGRGRDVVRVRPGRSRTFVVAADETTRVDWGNPVRAEFRTHRSGERVAFHPDEVRYFGAAGEEYVDFRPFGASPEFVVRERGGGEVARAVFGGSCSAGFAPVSVEVPAHLEIEVGLTADTWAFGEIGGEALPPGDEIE